MIPVFISQFSSFPVFIRNELNVSETESNWRFRKNVKTSLQNKKSYLMPPSRHGHFHPILILPVMMVELPQQHAIHMETSPQTKTSPVLCENQSFFFISKCFHHCVFLCYFLQYDAVFLIRFLDGCYQYIVFMDPVNGYSKSKLVVKE